MCKIASSKHVKLGEHKYCSIAIVHGFPMLLECSPNFSGYITWKQLTYIQYSKF